MSGHNGIIGNFLMASAVVVLACLGCAAMADARRTVIILDASASMAAALGDGTRLDAAKRAVKTARSVTHTHAPAQELALESFYDGCWVDVMARGAPVSQVRGELLSQIDGLRTRDYGHTPIARALEAAAELLTGRKGDIILVSDGQESCDKEIDLCRFATRLKAANVTLKVNLVGLALSRDQRKALDCVARNTGGAFLNADDSAGLEAALGLIAEDSVEESAAVRPCYDNRGGLLAVWCRE
ncbi:MAG: VWA domain-containing protein [Pseudomonadota bacterium]